MQEKILNFLKDIKNIKCWYPSAGNNFNAIKHWSANIGNDIQPKHFIFTDLKYLNEHLEIYLSLISKFFNVDLDNISYEKTETNIKLSPNSANLEYINYLEERKQLWMNEGSEDEILLKKLGLFNFDNDLIEEFETHYFKNKKSNLFCFYFNDISIWLLNCSNEDFYNYCVKEFISIDTIMLYRHCDNFIYNNEELIIKNLVIKESIGTSSYMEVSKKKLVKTNIFWESEYNIDPPIDKLLFIKY